MPIKARSNNCSSFVILDQHSETDRRSIPDAATVHFLLGRLWHNAGDVKKSVDSYVAALKLNPFAWEAFTGLCDTGILFRGCPLKGGMLTID